MSGTTKICPHCKDEYLVRIYSEKKKWCSGCGAWIPWDLAEKQSPLIGPARNIKK